MGELLVATVIKAEGDRTELVDVDNANERDPRGCTELDPAAFQPVEHHTEQAFLVKIKRLPSYNPLLNHPVRFDEIDTKFPVLFSSRFQSVHHLEFVHALVRCQAMHSNQMEHSTVPNLIETTLSMTPKNKRRKKMLPFIGLLFSCQVLIPLFESKFIVGFSIIIKT